jgi:putative hydrolase of the HAD superfamily
MAIRGVVFDLFHTLVDTEHLRPPGYHHTTRTAELLGLDPVPFRRWWDTTYLERETTPVDLVDVVERYLASRSLTPSERTEIDGFSGVARDDALRHPRPDVVELVRTLSERVSVGVLSNCYEREVRCWPESPLAPLVRAFTRSCDIGVMKPEPGAYRAALNPLGLDAGEVAFVGNGTSDELCGAARFGFARVVHCNVFDRHNGLVTEAEQRRRVGQSDVSVDTIAELDSVLRSTC